MVTLGIENLLKDPSSIKGKRVGLIANATSVDKKLTSTVDLLHNHPDINLTTLFGPQQGFWGETQDNMIEWQSGKYPIHELPLYSLYGEERKPTEEMLESVDTLIFDVQDVGTRIYTYIWTMVLAMQACAEQNKEFIICDRPNPINGIDTEGNVSTLEYSSFVGLYPLPLRHGMTAGEIANYVNSEFNINCDLKVVKMKDWNRKRFLDETDIPWIIPSANLPTLEGAIIYPGTVIFEGTNISEGRGTTRPFEFIGAPFINAFELADNLNRKKLKGVHFRACKFIPTFQKFKNEICSGIQIHVTDRNIFKPVETAVTLLYVIKNSHPDEFKWKGPPYEYTYDKSPIDMIFGSNWIREAIDSNKALNEMIEKIKSEAASFNKVREEYLLY